MSDPLTGYLMQVAGSLSLLNDGEISKILADPDKTKVFLEVAVIIYINTIFFFINSRKKLSN